MNIHHVLTCQRSTPQCFPDPECDPQYRVEADSLPLAIARLLRAMAVDLPEAHAVLSRAQWELAAWAKPPREAQEEPTE